MGDLAKPPSSAELTSRPSRPSRTISRKKSQRRKDKKVQLAFSYLFRFLFFLFFLLLVRNRSGKLGVFLGPSSVPGPTLPGPRGALWISKPEWKHWVVVTGAKSSGEEERVGLAIKGGGGGKEREQRVFFLKKRKRKKEEKRRRRRRRRRRRN